ncbi:hypothetical protein EDB92DRAFT_1936711 [Lactarius akahatsu]|uniref:Right handed beta helix domain-containing protein n=1 Tax=Lactarius akahatsu TaxID=416441 RepID=A0AAD4LA08_9AGAM|nr:hypothetical protein EDB92DRAFT_1936711 [Lactarius akahatsu]
MPSFLAEILARPHGRVYSRAICRPKRLVHFWLFNTTSPNLPLIFRLRRIILSVTFVALSRSRLVYVFLLDRLFPLPAQSSIVDLVPCISPDPANTVTGRLNIALNSSGPGFVLQLCPNAHYMIQAPILFAAPDQEISTVGYPTDDSRATLVVNGPVANGTGHTTAVDGTCSNCKGVKLRNIQVSIHISFRVVANIEMGGPNSNQLIEYVRSYDPRSWSCLHVAEGGLLCNNVTIQNNDIGPCGSDAYMQWADGISVSCRSAAVCNNLVNDPTDGGIVLFGSPGSIVENNIIWVTHNTLLGGINMVDVTPWGDSMSATQSDGANVDDVIIKIGIAIGPQTWFGDYFGANVSSSGTVLGNRFTGAFGYGIAITSARNFTVQDNVLLGNTSFIGSRGPNCSTSDPTPASAPFIVELANVTSTTLQPDFQSVQDAKGLTCIQPPDGGDYWPYGGNPQALPPLRFCSPSAKVGLETGSIITITSVIDIVVAVILRRKAMQGAVNLQFKKSVSRSRAASEAGIVKECL